MIKPVFKNIQNAIQTELFKATKSIKIAVAWFTNDLLYQVLLLKLQTGVSVELVLNDDEINRTSEHHLDFDKFIGLGGKLHWVSDKKLMHQKFCIIDDNVVINGSYNWTYKAEYNNENITIFEGEENVSNEYNEVYDSIIQKYPIGESNSNKSIHIDSIVQSIDNIKRKKHQIIISTNAHEEFAVADEYGALYSNDGKKLLKGVDLIGYEVKNGTCIICDKAFYNYRNIQTIILPNSVEYIGAEAFSCCMKLKEIVLSDNIRYYGRQAFYGCGNLISSIKINDSAIIEYGLFWNCSSLENIELPSNIETIPSMFACGCHSLKSIKIPQSVKIISAEAFYGCLNIHDFILPEKVELIGSKAFYQCFNIESLKIPNDYCHIEGNIGVPVSNVSSNYVVEDNTLFNEQKTALIYTWTKKDIYKVPDSVKSIGQSAFERTQVKEVLFHNNVCRIGKYAFANCRELQKITLPTSLSILEERLFANCENLTCVILPQFLFKIGSAAFRNCKNLYEISLPQSITTIESYAFEFCPLKELKLPESIVKIGTSIVSMDSNVKIIVSHTKLDIFNQLQNEGLNAHVDNEFDQNAKEELNDSICDILMEMGLEDLSAGEVKERFRKLFSGCKKYYNSKHVVDYIYELAAEYDLLYDDELFFPYRPHVYQIIKYGQPFVNKYSTKGLGLQNDLIKFV